MFYAFLPGKDYCPAHASLDKDCAPPPGHRLSIQVKKKACQFGTILKDWR